MGKYSEAPLGEFKRTMARRAHHCMVCKNEIPLGTYYFKEHQFLRFLQRPLAEICESCYGRGDFRVRSPQRGSDMGGASSLDRFL